MGDPFFERVPNPPLHASLADIPEKELVCRLVESPRFRENLLGIAGLPAAPLILQAEDLSDAPGAVEGDADLLFVEPKAPEAAVAVEAKRIKVHGRAFETARPNKLHEYAKAVEQANQLARIGFAQVYLYVFVVVDSREHNAGRYTFDGLTPELRAVVAAVVSLKDLDPRVGLAMYDLNQPMDHPPLTTGDGGIQLERLATPAAQPPELTRWLAELVATRS